MEETIRRPGNIRYNGRERRRQREYEKRKIFRNILRNSIICTIALMLFLIIYSTNMPFKKNVSNHIRNVLENNLTLKDIYASIDRSIGWLKNTAASLAPDTGVLSAGINNEDVKGDNITSGLKYPAPFPDGRIVSAYGTRIDPITNEVKLHQGIDIGAEHETEVKSVSDGEVIDIGNDKEYGKYIKIRDNQGHIITYANCLIIYANRTDKISTGAVIAKIGGYDSDMESHLHLEIWRDGKAVDPGSMIDL